MAEWLIYKLTVHAIVRAGVYHGPSGLGMITRKYGNHSIAKLGESRVSCASMYHRSYSASTLECTVDRQSLTARYRPPALTALVMKGPWVRARERGKAIKEEF